MGHSSRNDFLASASAAGLGRKIAAKHFDALANSFENALTETVLELTEQGFTEVKSIKEKSCKPEVTHTCNISFDFLSNT